MSAGSYAGAESLKPKALSRPTFASSSLIARIDEMQLRSLDLGFRDIGIELRPQASISLNLGLVQVILPLLDRFLVNRDQSLRL